MNDAPTGYQASPATFPVLADALFGGSRTWVDTRAWLRHAALILAGSALVALLAQVSIPMMPVPITGQSLGVLLVGMLLGARRGGLAMAAYLAQGAAGLPVFAGFTGGAAHLMGPTAGYLFAFVPAAMVVGWLARRGFDRRVLSATFAMTLGTAVIFAGGLAVLYVFAFMGITVGPGEQPSTIGVASVLSLGLTPFLPGAVAKIVIAALLLPQGWKLLGAVGEPRRGA